MRLFKQLSVLACIFLFLACSSIGSNLPWKPSQNFDESNQSIADLLGDMPVPNGAQIQNENTLIIGKGVGWVGRANLSAMQSSNEVYSFFLAEFPKAGWSVISATKSKTSIMVATKDDRTCTVEVSDGPFTGPKTVISITSSPKNAPIKTKAK